MTLKPVVYSGPANETIWDLVVEWEFAAGVVCRIERNLRRDYRARVPTAGGAELRFHQFPEITDLGRFVDHIEGRR